VIGVLGTGISVMGDNVSRYGLEAKFSQLCALFFN